MKKIIEPKILDDLSSGFQSETKRRSNSEKNLLELKEKKVEIHTGGDKDLMERGEGIWKWLTNP